MTWTNEQTAIEARFTGWPTRIKWPGKPFLEPATAYIAPHILNGAGQIASLGTPTLRRHTGVVNVQIFDKENRGEATIRSLADQVEALFIDANSRLTISAGEFIDFGQPSLSPAQSANGWLQRNVVVPFFRDEVRPSVGPPPPGVGAGTPSPWQADVFTLSGPQTVFTLSGIPTGGVALFVNGMWQTQNTFTVSGAVATITGFTPDAGDTVEFLY